MFKKWLKRFLPNPLDRMLKKKGIKKILLGWNRGLGDIPLGLYAIIERIKEFIPDAEITFVTRHNLVEGFSLLGIKTIVDPKWRRGEAHHINPDLKKQYDLVIEKPSPTDWVSWQLGKVVPKLKWDAQYDFLYERFDLPPNCIGVQVAAETSYGLWRNWPIEKWEELFSRMPNETFLLFGFGDEPKFKHPNVMDLRGQTTLFELLSIIKHRTKTLILPDSGISAMVYYLNEAFPIRHVTLWADPKHGILKQAVSSPNPQLQHHPLVAKEKNLANLTVDEVMGALQKKVLPILLAGGQGTRLGVKGPKGLFEIGGKTLFQWFCDKLPKGSPLAIMTSPLNHEETVAYFKQHGFFGLNVHFFEQEMGDAGPNGNGNVFRAFQKAGLQFEGIECVTVSYIDNPLTKPLDPKLTEPNADVVVQCIQREKEDRSMGVLVECDGRYQIVEYTELNPETPYQYAYSGQLAFSYPFFCEMGHKELPLHFVEKIVDGKKIQKGEQFIFDVFPYAKTICSVCVDRKTHYAPIKGPESIAKVLELI